MATRFTGEMGHRSFRLMTLVLQRLFWSTSHPPMVHGTTLSWMEMLLVSGKKREVSTIRCHLTNALSRSVRPAPNVLDRLLLGHQSALPPPRQECVIAAQDCLHCYAWRGP